MSFTATVCVPLQSPTQPCRAVVAVADGVGVAEGAGVADGVTVGDAVGGATPARQRPLATSHVSMPLLAFWSSHSASLRQASAKAPRP